jgi:class 3 adenylate cyclase
MNALEKIIAPHPEEAAASVWFQEEARAERIAGFVRTAYLLVWLAVCFLGREVNRGEPNVVNFIGGGAWLAASLAYQAFLRFRPYRAGLKYASLTGDLLISFAMFYFYSLDVAGPVTTLKSPTFMSTFLILALAALRFNSRLPLYGGIVSLAAYGGIVLSFVVGGRIRWGDRLDMVTTEKVNATYLLFNAAYLATFVIVLVVLVRHARRLVRLRGEEAERAAAEKHERQKALSTLERYFTPQLARHLLENPGALGGRLQEATIVVADIRNFTRLSETQGPVKTVQFLNALFEKMVAIVFKHGGTLDKYLGDGMLIAFGVPEARPDDALRAVRAAREMVGAAESVGDWAGVTLGCAIHSGQVLMGNVGVPSRMEFTVIGDVVNTASRMEQLNKHFRTTIILTEATYGKVRDAIEVRELPSTEIRGKAEIVRLYEFTAWKGAPA